MTPRANQDLSIFTKLPLDILNIIAKYSNSFRIDKTNIIPLLCSKKKSRFEKLYKLIPKSVFSSTDNFEYPHINYYVVLKIKSERTHSVFNEVAYFDSYCQLIDIDVGVEMKYYIILKQHLLSDDLDDLIYYDTQQNFITQCLVENLIKTWFGYFELNGSIDSKTHKAYLYIKTH